MALDLTSGNEKKAMILFSLPMIFGNMLQQLYNVADTLIVGKILGPNALAAVGSSYALMVLLTSIILGLCMGSGVVFAQLFGAKEMKQLKTSVFNAFVFILMVNAIIHIISYVFLDRFVIWLHIPFEVVQDTRAYLRIILIGMTFVFIYNFIAAVLRSVGNTIIPLVFLGVSAVTNIGLDILFIAEFNMGIEGAATATVIAQAISAIAITIYFFVKARNICPQREHMHYDKILLKRIISNSLLTSIQQSIMNFGILMIQGLVNSFGVAATAAFAVVVKIDAFAYMPAQDFGNAFATFIAQNHGAKETARIQRGTRAAVKLSSCFCILASSLVFLFAEQFMLIFVQPKEHEIIKIGIQYLHIEGACYVGIGILFLLYGYYRGLEKSMMSILLTIVSLGSRVAIAYILAPIEKIGLVGIWWAIPIGWVLADLLGVWYLRRKK